MAALTAKAKKNISKVKRTTRVVKRKANTAVGLVTKLRFHYAWHYKYSKVRDSVILFESFHGKTVSDSPLHMLMEFLDEPRSAGFEIYYATMEDRKEEHQALIDQLGLKVKLVPIESRRYVELLATAKFLVNNSSFPAYFTRRPEQRYIQTWHGTPLKTLGKQMRLGIESMYNVQHNFLQSSILTFPNEFTRHVMMRDYNLEELYTGKVALTGYPRNCVFFDDEKAQQIKDLYGLNGIETFAYMPTWRGKNNYSADVENYRIQVMGFLRSIDAVMRDDQMMFVNFHSMVAAQMGDFELSHVRSFPKDQDNYEFLNAMDVLVTDYSSVFFDYSITRKPIILFAYDEEEYLEGHGMYLDIHEFPFQIVRSIGELTQSISTGEFRNYTYEGGDYDERFLAYDSPKNAKVALDLLFNDHSDSALIMDYSHNRGRKWNTIEPRRQATTDDIVTACADMNAESDVVIFLRSRFNEEKSETLNDLVDDSFNFVFITKAYNCTGFEQFMLKRSEHIREKVMKRERDRIFPGLDVPVEPRRNAYAGTLGTSYICPDGELLQVPAKCDTMPDGTLRVSVDSNCYSFHKVMLVKKRTIVAEAELTAEEVESGFLDSVILQLLDECEIAESDSIRVFLEAHDNVDGYIFPVEVQLCTDEELREMKAARKKARARERALKREEAALLELAAWEEVANEDVNWDKKAQRELENGLKAAEEAARLTAARKELFAEDEEEMSAQLEAGDSDVARKPSFAADGDGVLDEPQLDELADADFDEEHDVSGSLNEQASSGSDEQVSNDVSGQDETTDEEVPDPVLFKTDLETGAWLAMTPYMDSRGKLRFSASAVYTGAPDSNLAYTDRQLPQIAATLEYTDEGELVITVDPDQFELEKVVFVRKRDVVSSRPLESKEAKTGRIDLSLIELIDESELERGDSIRVFLESRDEYGRPFPIEAALCDPKEKPVDGFDNELYRPILKTVYRDAIEGEWLAHVAQSEITARETFDKRDAQQMRVDFSDLKDIEVQGELDEVAEFDGLENLESDDDEVAEGAIGETTEEATSTQAVQLESIGQAADQGSEEILGEEEILAVTPYRDVRGKLRLYCSAPEKVLGRFTKNAELVSIGGSSEEVAFTCRFCDGMFIVEDVVLRLRHKTDLLEAHLPYKLIADGEWLTLEARFNPSNYEFREVYWDAFVVVRYLGVRADIRIQMSPEQIKRLKRGNQQWRIGEDKVLFTHIAGKSNLAFVYRDYYPRLDTYMLRVKEFAALGVYLAFKKHWDKKRIWLVYEKFCSLAQDNAFYFFQYCMSLPPEQRKHIFYVIDKSKPDYANVAPYGKQVLDFMSFKHILYALVAKLYVASDSKSHLYVWRNKPSFVRGRISKHRIFFLQHGVTAMKQVAHLFGKKGSSPMTFFLTTSRREQDIVVENFGYTEKQAPVLGFSRWDVLEDRSSVEEPSILLMPTWRPWLEEQSDEVFVASEYFERYSSLIASQALADVLERYNATLRFFIHPKLSEQLGNFTPPSERIQLVAQGSEPLNEVMMRSNMVITDYSSVCWDMLYMDKPVVFYQFDQALYEAIVGSYVNLNEDLPGDVCLTEAEVVRAVEECAERGFSMRDEHAEMAEGWFAAKDTNNRQRTYDFIVSKGY